MGSDDTADDVVRAYLVEHARALVETVPGLRAGDGEAVHDARTASRRLRTALAVYGGGSDELLATLRDLGHALGAARDPVVELHALRAILRAEAPDLVRGPVALRIDEDLTSAEQSGLDEVGGWLGSGWAELARLLDEEVGAGRGPDPADASDLAGLRRGARRAWRRLDRAVDALDALVDDDRDEALHEVRKAARRARYASEVASGAFGRPARKSAKRARALQEVLGEQHDAVVRRETLRRLGLQAFADGEDTFTYGRLHALAQEAASAAEHDASRLVDRATSRRHRHWTA